MWNRTMSKPVICINADYAADGRRWFHRSGRGYSDSVAEAGATPVILPCMEDPGLAAEYVGMADGMLFTGSLDYPSSWFGEPVHPLARPVDARRAGADYLLAKLAIASGKPLLGICGGMQLLNIVLGGRLIQHIPNADDHLGEKHHAVRITAGKTLGRLFGFGPIRVNSAHHQAVAPDGVGEGLAVVAHAEDGTIEAFESTGGRFLLGVQWHPERIDDAEHRRRIFAAFADAAR